jgi:NCS1 family nucleobase:cation symporter-1
MKKLFGDGFIEKRSIGYIPLSERHGKVWHLWPIWFSGEANLASVVIGVVGIAMGGNLIWTAIAVVLGAAFGTFFMAFHSTQGPQLGLPQMIQSRPQFGYVGALLVWGIALIAYIGYNAFNQILVAQTLHSLYGTPPTPTLLAVALISVWLAIVGYDLIHVVLRWVAYVTIAFLLLFTVAVAFNAVVPAAQLDLHNFRASPFLAQFFAAASLQLSWSVYVSDYSRYLPRDVGLSASFWWTYVGAFIGGSWTMLIGTVAAALYPRLGFWCAIADLYAARTGDRHGHQFLRRIADLDELHRYREARTSHAHAPAGDIGRLGSCGYRPLPGVDRRFRGQIRRISGGAPLPVHAMDGNQSG